MKRSDRLPSRPTGEVDPLTTGRGLSSLPPSPELAPPSSVAKESASPFQSFAPSTDEMQAEARRRREASSGVMAIVGGLAFMVSTAVVALLAALLVALFLAFRPDRQLAGGDADAGNVLDTAVAPVGPGKGPAKGGPAPDAPEPEPGATGPELGTVTLVIPPGAMFYTAEVVCPSGIRQRGKFRRGKAKVYNVPVDERCEVTFQGSNFVKWWVSGHMTLVCTQFEPVPKCEER